MPVLEGTEPIVRRVRWESTDEGRESLVWKEWLVTNGLGGYSSGSVAGGVGCGWTSLASSPICDRIVCPIRDFTRNSGRAASAASRSQKSPIAPGRVSKSGTG